MNYKKLYLVLKIILIVLLVVLMLTIQKYKTSDCAYCEFEVEGKNENLAGLLTHYFEVCLEEDDLPILINSSTHSSQ